MRAHFVGVGGVGMPGLAPMFAGRGALVSASDVGSNPTVDRLRQFGIRLHERHVPLLVYDPQVSKSDPERLWAALLGVTQASGPRVFARLMRAEIGLDLDPGRS